MEEMRLKSKIITTWEIKLASMLFGIKTRQGKDDIFLLRESFTIAIP